jgi:hypothetical protein
VKFGLVRNHSAPARYFRCHIPREFEHKDRGFESRSDQAFLLVFPYVVL